MIVAARFRVRADVLVARYFQNSLHLGDGNHRRHAAENQVAHKEQSDGTDKNADLDPGRRVVTPRRRQEVTRQRSGDDYESLEPHPYVHHDAQEESPPDAAADFARPEQLWTDYVAEHHAEIRPPVDTEYTVVEGKLLVDIAGIPGDEQLRQISHTDNRTCEHDYLVHGFNVVDRDVLFEFQNFAGEHHEGLHHGKTGEDGARYEVRREDSGMPARNNRSSKVKGYDRVYRKYERGRNTGQNQ